MELETFKEKLKYKEENLFASMDDPLSENVYSFDISSDINFADVNTMFTKDHKTISWIRSFKKNSIFFDIGAGVGINSIFAGAHSKAKVYSFEPEASNYNSLVKNIFINKLNENILPYNIALSDETKFAKLYLSQFKPGSGNHMFDESVDSSLNPMNFPYYQHGFSLTIDELVENFDFPVPNYIKIDVDGLENKIIKGSKNILKEQSLLSLQVKTNQNISINKKMIEFIKKYNFEILEMNELNENHNDNIIFVKK